MLCVRPIDLSQSRYYLEGPAPGRWIGTGPAELGLTGLVDGTALRAVLAGRDPDGDPLLHRVTRTRRSGFDLIVASPKSVSLLAALGDEEHLVRFREAHNRAVSSALGYLEREAVWARRGRPTTQIATAGLVGAAFDHTLSGARDPHLHTHVVVANLVHAEDGRWSTLDSRSLFRHAGAAGAVFQATLRHHLAEVGLAFEWAVDRHGLGNVVGVPRRAIDAASLRHRQVVQEIEEGLAGRVGKASAAGRTRRDAATPAEPWPGRVAAAGMDHNRVNDLLMAAARRTIDPPGVPGAGPDPEALGRWLSEHHSRFRRPDVVRAAAAVSIRGAPEPRLNELASRFLETALPAGGDMWTTPTLRRLEARIVAGATGAPRRPRSAVEVRAGPATEGLTETGKEAVARLVTGGAPVELVRGDLLDLAGVLSAARHAWESGGHRVGVASTSERSQARWRTLAGLEPLPPSPAHATVVVVDNAERWSTADLDRVTADALARRAHVVLLDGGTQPRRSRAESPAMESLRSSLVAIDAGPRPPALAPPTAEHVVGPVVRAGRDAAVTLAPTADRAMHALVQDWQQERSAGGRPRMVALGPEEAEHLNALARTVRDRLRELTGPIVTIGDRQFRAGDEVMALRRDPRLGAVPGGTVGRVTEVDPGAQRATVVWEGRSEAVTVAAAGAARARIPLAYAYATTPSYLRAGWQGRVMSLGDVAAVAPSVKPDRIYDILPPPVARRTPEVDPMRDLIADLPDRADLPGRHAGAPGASTMPDEAGRALAELAEERDHLAESLRASAPPDTRAEMRRLSEERDWLASVPDRPGRTERATARLAVEGRLAELQDQARDRGLWLERQRGRLDRWAELANAIAWREAALGRAAEIRPTVAVLSQLGAPPPEPSPRAVWRKAAEAVESYRERWGIPDRPLQLDRAGHPEPELASHPSRRAGELRVIATSRELHRDLRRDLGRDQALTR